MNFTEKSFRSLNSLGFHNIVYSDWAPRNKRKDGRIIIGIHGLTCNGHDFDALAEALAEQGHRFIAMDLPGRGRSDFLPNPMDYNPIQYSRDIAALFAHLDISENQSIDFLGVSLGGMLGIALAGVQNSPITRLIINDVGTTIPQEALDYIGKIVLQPRYFETLKDLELDLRNVQRIEWGNLSNEQWHYMAEHNARAIDDGRITYAYDPNIALPFAQTIEQGNDAADLWPYWDNITCPVMLIRGEQSKLLTSKIVREMQERYKGGDNHMKFVEFNNCGHVPSLWEPDHIEAIISWLNSTPI